MDHKHRRFIGWFYLAVTVLTLLAIVGIVGFEVYVRWTLNQNYSVLDQDAFPALLLLFGAEMLGLVWLLRSE